MNLSPALKKLGFKEYTPVKWEGCQRAWQKKLSDDTFINVNWYDLSEIFLNHKEARELNEWEIEIYYQHKDCAIKILVYAMKDFKRAWKMAKKFVEAI